MSPASAMIPWTEPQSLFDVLNGATPFFGIGLTFAVYYAAVKLHEIIGAPVLLHPLVLTIAAIAFLLNTAGVPYDDYYRSVELLHWLLGPAVILLAVPLWRHLATIRKLGIGVLFVLLAGSLTGVATSVGIAFAFAAPDELTLSIAPRSVTTPVAIHLSESLGGVPAITALIVILTGLAGATIGWPLLQALGFRDPRAKGLAMGVAAHVIGTARVFQIDQLAGAFAGLGMILNALTTAVLIAIVRCLFV
jgi:predicted murein hydrolase (TIGR00659 family)